MWATSFSVVQNTTLGASPPGMRRRLPRNSYPSMIGMFQSRRMASGKPRLQTSRAFSPSSASTIWKSRPSRIRRATFRMTLESSTTRHVLILSLCFFQSREGHYHCNAVRPLAVSGRNHVRDDFKDAIDVENDHELAVEAMDTAGKLGHARIEIDGIFLAAVLGQAQHFPDLVDEESIGFTAQVHADRHRRLAVVGLGQPQAGAHVDHR